MAVFGARGPRFFVHSKNLHCIEMGRVHAPVMCCVPYREAVIGLSLVVFNNSLNAGRQTYLQKLFCCYL